MKYYPKNFSITAFLVGGILGASAGLLFSPKSGKELRGTIKSKTDDYLNKAGKNNNDVISSSRTSAELLIRNMEDRVDTIRQYIKEKVDKPFSIIEKEIAGIKAAVAAVKASYSLNPEIHQSNIEMNDGQISLNEFGDETLPKHLGMGKGRNRKSYYW